MAVSQVIERLKWTVKHVIAWVSWVSIGPCTASSKAKVLQLTSCPVLVAPVNPLVMYCQGQQSCSYFRHPARKLVREQGTLRSQLDFKMLRAPCQEAGKG